MKKNRLVNIGYITASNEVMKDEKPVCYIYREDPDDSDDSGWRIFSGEESDAYMENYSNFSLYNASTIIEKFPYLSDFLSENYPVSYERASKDQSFDKI